MGLVQGGSACRESKGQRPWAWCRAAAPARDARERPLLWVQGRSAMGRVQGDNACAVARQDLALSPEAARSGPVKC